MPIRRRAAQKMFETRSHAWQQVGLLREVSPRVVKRARAEAIMLVLAFAGVVLLYRHRVDLLGAAGTGRQSSKELPSELDAPVRAVTVIALLILGWAIARDFGRGLGPPLFRRLDPGTAGTVGFLIRLATVALALLVALSVAGVDPATLAVGGAFTALIFGLAGQQTLGNVIAGTVLLSARPFRVGDRVRFQGGGIAGQIEGTVSSLGLLYTTLARGDGEIMVPNSVVLNIAVMPLREPDAINLRAKLRQGMAPRELQELIERELPLRLREAPRITLESLDGDEVVVQISARPLVDSDAPALASDLLRVVSAETAAAAESAQSEPASSADGAPSAPAPADARTR
jgi:small-conductance mechanosensitive channel